MPDETPAEKLEWTEGNLSTVLSDLLNLASTDQSVHDQLMTSPFDLLSAQINVPEEFREMIIAKEPTAKVLVLNVPAFGQRTEALPAGTTEAAPSPLFQVICTVDPVW